MKVDVVFKKLLGFKLKFISNQGHTELIVTVT